MFEHPRYIQNSFSLFIQEQQGVAHYEREIFSILKGLYFRPRPIQSPSGVNPDAAGLLFQSEHGHSQIVVTNATVALNVSYSPDWQTHPDLAHSYMMERTQLLFDIAGTVSEEPYLFSGSVTRAQLPSHAGDEEIAAFVARIFAGKSAAQDYHDLVVRSTTVVDELYFSNLTVQNYRVWSTSLPPAAVHRVSRHSATERGLEILSDFNSRYAFNEDKPFPVTSETAHMMLKQNFEIVQQTINQAQEAAQ